MTNVIACGDNLAILQDMPDGIIDLCYIDPPFFTNKNYEVIWGDREETRSFEDRWEGGINHYIEWMRPRVQAIHRVLRPTGSFYLHCDYHADAYLRVLCDQIFGYENFGNQIVWCYSGASSPNMKNFARKHDIILCYHKGKSWTFNADDVRLPYADSSKGREGFKKKFKIDGDLEGGACKLNPKGKFPEDWWQIPFIRPNATERLGYPTQKPEALLERIIKASSNEGDVVLDCFCGCGTTLAVAKKLGRQYIGIDISPTACKLVAKRIDVPESSIVNLPRTPEDLAAMTPFEFQNWACEQFDAVAGGKGADKGIDGRCRGTGVVLQVKQTKVGRPVVDTFETAMRRMKATKGAIIGLSFSKDAFEEMARAAPAMEIKGYTVEEIINGKHFDDGMARKRRITIERTAGDL